MKKLKKIEDIKNMPHSKNQVFHIVRPKKEEITICPEHHQDSRKCDECLPRPEPPKSWEIEFEIAKEREAFAERIRGMKRPKRIQIGAIPDDGYNQAISDILQILNSK